MHNVLHCFLLLLKLERLSDEHKNLIKVVKKEIEGFKEGSIKISEAKNSKFLLNAKIRKAQTEDNIYYKNAPSCLIDYVMNNGNMMNYSFGMVALVLFLLL